MTAREEIIKDFVKQEIKKLENAEALYGECQEGAFVHGQYIAYKKILKMLNQRY